MSDVRAVVGARVSVVSGPEKVSHYAQHETGLRYAEQHAWTVVGTFEDLGVSAGKVRPHDRPDLKPWLAEERLHEWDALIFSKIDRMFRSTDDCVTFAKWCKQHSKILVFAEDGFTLNYRDPGTELDRMMSELFTYLGSFFAQVELSRFRSRAIDAHRVLRQTTRWAGSRAPDGFKTVPHPDGKGRALAHDPVRQAVLHAAANKIIQGWSLNRVAQWLTAEGYPVADDYRRPPEKRRGRVWVASQVRRMLSSPATQGIKITQGSKPVLDPSGEPIQVGPPSFDSATWQELQNAIELRIQHRRHRTKQRSPLNGIVFCGCCRYGAGRRRAESTSGRVHYYYGCSRSPKPCPGVQVRADVLASMVEDLFLEYRGHEFVKTRVFVPASDTSVELSDVNTRISALRADRELGLYPTEADEQEFRNQISALLSRRTELESQPQRAAGWRTEEGDKTYAEVWQDSTEDERRTMLLDATARCWLMPGHCAVLQISEGGPVWTRYATGEYASDAALEEMAAFLREAPSP